MIPYIHFMTKDGEGWASPAEIPEVCSGTYVVPLKEDGDFYEKYNIDIVYYSEDNPPKKRPIETIEVALEDDKLIAYVNENRLAFSLNKDLKYSYTGTYKHADFSVPLFEIVPEFDLEIFNKERFALIGCDPWTKYENIK